MDEDKSVDQPNSHATNKTNRLAMTSFILGILGAISIISIIVLIILVPIVWTGGEFDMTQKTYLLSWYLITLSIGLTAIILSGIAARAVNKSGAAERGYRLAVAGLVLGILVTIPYVFWFFTVYIRH
jgi:uncharacterized protein YqgC (DUF456 family)